MDHVDLINTPLHKLTDRIMQATSSGQVNHKSRHCRPTPKRTHQIHKPNQKKHETSIKGRGRCRHHKHFLAVCCACRGTYSLQVAEARSVEFEVGGSGRAGDSDEQWSLFGIWVTRIPWCKISCVHYIYICDMCVEERQRERVRESERVRE